MSVSKCTHCGLVLQPNMGLGCGGPCNFVAVPEAPVSHLRRTVTRDELAYFLLNSCKLFALQEYALTDELMAAFNITTVQHQLPSAPTTATENTNG